MTIKIRIPKARGENAGRILRWLPRDPVLRAALVAFLILAVSFTVLFSYFYIKYDRIIEKRFRTPIFANSAKIYALPKTVRDGEKIDPRRPSALATRASRRPSPVVCSDCVDRRMVAGPTPRTVRLLAHQRS